MSRMVTRSSEPIAGYQVTERLGAGGYGEVWKAEAPGGLLKAIKFIYGYLSDDKAARELKALNRIKQLRHPFLLSLERIEVVEGQLIIVTELADMSLKDRFLACKDEVLPGIPRDELLNYLRDAADGLDYLTGNSLQHLDVKPENLLLVGGRVKVADFGLLKEIHDRTCSMMGGLTPIYAPPEVFDGRPNAHSDQYSLAIVYQELLTGELPFPGTTAAQLATQHLHSRPRLDALPPGDRSALARALSKNPLDRFANCRAMVDALLAAGQAEAAPHESERRDANSGGHTDAREALRRTPAPRLPHHAPPQPAAGRLTETRTKTAPPPRMSAVARNLPPLEIGPEETGLRPTLFLGLGGTGGFVLRRLRRRLVDRFGDLGQMPAFRTLLIDSDSRALSQMARSDDRYALPASETLPMPLRKPQDYQQQSPEVLQWLSRRWLYNIPRSLQTEGLRPLGRLALVDHAGELTSRLREALVSISAKPAIEQTCAHAQMPLRCQPPRIFVVASVSGGTGGGMALDVAYLIRMLLSELQLSDSGLCGILTHSTNRKPSSRELAVSNAYACLSELYHYSRIDRYPGDKACGIAPFDRDEPTFPQTYFVPLGDHLSEGEFHRATDTLAEYLYLDAATSAGAFFDKCRAELPVPGTDAAAGLTVRTLGVCQIGCSQSEIPAASGDMLCKALIERWRGARQSLPSESPADANAQNEGIPAYLRSPEALLAPLRAAVRTAIGSDLELFLGGIAAQLMKDPAGASSAPGDQVLAALIQNATVVLGLARLEGMRDSRQAVELSLVLDEAVSRQSTNLSAQLVRHVAAVADQPGFRIAGAQSRRNRLVGRLRELEQGLVKAQQSCDSDLALASAQVAAALSPPTRGRAAKRSDSNEDPTSLLTRYLQRRIEQMLVNSAQRVVNTLLNDLAQMSERIVGAQRQLNTLSKSFEGASAWSELLVPPEDPQDGLLHLQAAVAQELDRRMPTVLDRLENHLIEHLVAPRGGLVQFLTGDGDQLTQLAPDLRSAARSQVVAEIRAVDVARLLVEPIGEAEAPSVTLPHCIKQAWPPLLRCGGAARLMIMLPQSTDESVKPRFHGEEGQPAVTLLTDSDSDVVACFEAQEVSVANVAADLTADSTRYAEVARRLHTRIDVNWSHGLAAN